MPTTGTAHVNVSALRPGWTITHLLPAGADPDDPDAWTPVGTRVVARESRLIADGVHAVELRNDGRVQVMVYRDRWDGARVVTSTPGGRAPATVVQAARDGLGWEARGGNYYDRHGAYTGVKSRDAMLSRAQSAGVVVMDIPTRRWHRPVTFP